MGKLSNKEGSGMLANRILSDVTVYMKYAKFIEGENRREDWDEIVHRNKEMHIKRFPDMKEEIENAYSYVYRKSVLPSMRSMQFAGKPIEISPNRIYNCAYLPIDNLLAFNETMFLLLGGTGVGYSVQFHHVEQLPEIQKPNPNRKRRFLIGDSIEGWADSIKVLMKSYFGITTSTVEFDYSDIRKKGAILKTSGGTAPGKGPLNECLVKIKNLLDLKRNGDKLSTLEVHDILCYIADAVLAGGIRRAALISLFSADDMEMLSCKAGNWWELNPQRGRANNSAVLLRHRITKPYFMELMKKIRLSGSGEPGIYLSNDKDWGTNPCCEIALRPFQFCNLVEVNVSNIQSSLEFKNRVEAATFIATLQAGYTDFHYLREVWQNTTEKDGLIGVSMTGIASGKVLNPTLLADMGTMVKNYNKEIAGKIGINPAARTTCVKPAGTTSCVLGTSSGIHAWHSKYYIRRVRVDKSEMIYNYLLNNHPELIEDDYFNSLTTAIISLPQIAPHSAITRDNETAIDLLERVKLVSNNWVKAGHETGMNTHNVSATISVKDDEWDEVGNWFWNNRDCYNGLTVIPYDGGTHVQAPFESISKYKFDRMLEVLKLVDLTKVVESNDTTNLAGEVACAGGSCEMI